MNRMNVLMIYPEMPDTIGKLDSIVKLSGRKSSFPPIGLLTVASMLPPEWNLRLIDLNTDPLRETDLEWAEYVMISAMNVQSQSAHEIVELCKRKGIKTIAGGPLFTHEYHKYPGVTHFVLNEAEITLPQFLADFKEGNAKPIYTASDFANVAETPIPKWDLIDLSKYMYSIVQYSRGCPYLCDFCDVTALFGRIPRVKTGKRVIQELEAMPRNGKNEMIFFADDNLIGNKRILKNDLLPALIEWRAKNPDTPPFSTQLTITLADDPELMDLLLEAGFRHILIGIESINEASLIRMKKKQNVGRNLLEEIRMIQRKGFIVIGTFIVGLDDDPPSVFDDIATFIRESNIVFAIVNVLKAPYGTELHERMKKEGRLIPDLDFGEHRSNIVLAMGEETVTRGYNRMIDHVYDPEDVYRRSISYFKNLEPIRVKTRIGRKVTLREVMQLFVMLKELCIVFPGRKYVWKLLAWILWHRTNYFALALLFSLTMHQYWRQRKFYDVPVPHVRQPPAAAVETVEPLSNVHT